MAFDNLIRWEQIKGGPLLKTDVESLKTSYDALKVLTNISKGEDLGNYNVNELLVVLKTAIESITGGGSGSGGSLVEIQQQIDILNNKVIKDVVKVEMNVVNNVIVLPPNLSDLVPNIDTSKHYPVYNINNTVIFNENGGQLMFDFTNNVFIGIPSILDPNCKDPKNPTYIKIENDFAFKVFAIGSFTFINLPADALLDNQEMVVLAYNQVLNQIIINLANNTELINQIKILVSTEAIQQQILAITNILEQRLTQIETNGCKVNNQYISTVINDIDVATDIKVTSEKAVAIAIANASVNIKNEINTNIVNVTDRLEALESFKEQVDTITVTETDAKTQFVLTKIPNELEIVLKINGVDYHENEAFTANREEKIVTWTATKAQGGFDINKELTPVVRVVYKVESVKKPVKYTEVLFDTPGAFTFRVPEGVSNLKVACVSGCEADYEVLEDGWVYDANLKSVSAHSSSIGTVSSPSWTRNDFYLGVANAADVPVNRAYGVGFDDAEQRGDYGLIPNSPSIYKKANSVDYPAPLIEQKKYVPKNPVDLREVSSLKVKSGQELQGMVGKTNGYVLIAYGGDI